MFVRSRSLRLATGSTVGARWRGVALTDRLWDQLPAPSRVYAVNVYSVPLARPVAVACSALPSYTSTPSAGPLAAPIVRTMRTRSRSLSLGLCHDSATRRSPALAARSATGAGAVPSVTVHSKLTSPFSGGVPSSVAVTATSYGFCGAALARSCR